MAEDTNISDTGGERRPLLDKIEEIKARHLGDAKKSSDSLGDVEIMYKKQALSKALKALDKRRQENMRDYKNMKERNQAAFQAMMQTQARQKGQRGGQQGGPAQASPAPQIPQRGGGLIPQAQGQQPQRQPAPQRAPGNSNLLFDSHN